MKSILNALLPGLICFFAAMVPARGAEPGMKGIFKGNDKPANLAFVSARKGEPVFDKEAIVFIFSGKDHSKAAKPENSAGFGDFGSVLVVIVNSDGQILGRQVAHSAHGKGSFSSGGTLKLTDYTIANGRLSGKISSGAVSEFFKKTGEVELAFHTKAA
ncbi:MAG: hypothetical protein ABIP20_03400 [Chthoniobacteraceae bacterium]